MSVEIYIWHGELSEYTVINGVIRGNVGHASMKIIDDTGQLKDIYISHRPKAAQQAKNNEKDDSKRYAFKKDFSPVAKPITFDEEIKLRKGKKYETIKLSGLDENRIRKCYKKYRNGDLPENKTLYNIRKNNCCSVVVYFLREGLRCSEKKCKKCIVVNNLPDKEHLKARRKRQVRMGIAFAFLAFPTAYRLNEVIHGKDDDILFSFVSFVSFFVLYGVFQPKIRLFFNLESRIAKNSSNFWSPITLEYFARRLEKRQVNQCFLLKADSLITTDLSRDVEEQTSALFDFLLFSSTGVAMFTILIIHIWKNYRNLIG